MSKPKDYDGGGMIPTDNVYRGRGGARKGAGRKKGKGVAVICKFRPNKFVASTILPELRDKHRNMSHFINLAIVDRWQQGVGHAISPLEYAAGLLNVEPKALKAWAAKNLITDEPLPTDTQ